jgi:hypothetical protein
MHWLRGPQRHERPVSASLIHSDRVTPTTIHPHLKPTRDATAPPTQTLATTTEVIAIVEDPPQQATAETTKVSKKRGERLVHLRIIDKDRNQEHIFACPLSLILTHMTFFVEYMKRFDAGTDSDIEIPIHCDLDVFAWIYRWIQAVGVNGDAVCSAAESPVLTVNRVVGVLVASQFLGMPKLHQQAAQFIAANFENVLDLSVDLTGMLDSTTAEIEAFLPKRTLEQVWISAHRQNRIHEKLSDLNGEPPSSDDVTRHACRMRLMVNKFYRVKLFKSKDSALSLSESLRKCKRCHDVYGHGVASALTCKKARLVVDFRGNIAGKHISDPDFSSSKYVDDLRAQRQPWRTIFWRIWALNHAGRCKHCGVYELLAHRRQCRMHACEPHNGIYPCCGEEVRYMEESPGCMVRDHDWDIDNLSSKEASVMAAFSNLNACVEDIDSVCIRPSEGPSPVAVPAGVIFANPTAFAWSTFSLKDIERSSADSAAFPSRVWSATSKNAAPLSNSKSACAMLRWDHQAQNAHHAYMNAVFAGELATRDTIYHDLSDSESSSGSDDEVHYNTRPPRRRPSSARPRRVPITIPLSKDTHPMAISASIYTDEFGRRQVSGKQSVISVMNGPFGGLRSSLLPSFLALTRVVVWIEDLREDERERLDATDRLTKHSWPSPVEGDEKESPTLDLVHVVPAKAGLTIIRVPENAHARARKYALPLLPIKIENILGPRRLSTGSSRPSSAPTRRYSLIPTT